MVRVSPSRRIKYHPLIWLFMTSRMKKGLRLYWDDVNGLLRKAKRIYRKLLKRVEGVSDDNPMASNITMSFVIISIWLASKRKITPDQMTDILDRALDWLPMKLYVGMVDMNRKKGIRTFEKMMKKNREWARRHPGDWNTWDFHFDKSLHKDGFYYHFTHCPIASFCQKYGYQEINPVLCNLDYTTMGMMHGVLHRDHTVAEGGGICDYWIVGDKIKNPR